MGILLQSGFRVGYFYLFQNFNGLPANLRPGHFFVQGKAFPNLRADGHGRVEISSRVLKNHRNLLAADVLQGFLRKPRQVLPFKHNLGFFRSFRNIFWQQLDDGFGGHGFPAAAFPNNNQCFLMEKVKGNIPDCFNFTGIGVQGNGQVFNFKHFFHGYIPPIGEVSGQERPAAHPPAFGKTAW